MSASMLELVELADGEIVLQREDSDAEPLVTIRFSEESRMYMRDNGLDVARAMIQAGIAAVAEQSEQAESEATAASEETPRVLH